VKHDPGVEHVSVLIVGSGFAGLGAAIRLEQAGRSDFLVIERSPDVGGTWRDNTYPGVVCDVPTHLYSLWFAPNPDWSRVFSPQGEIQDYLRRTAEQSGTLDRQLFNCALLSARWDSDHTRVGGADDSRRLHGDHPADGLGSVEPAEAARHRRRRRFPGPTPAHRALGCPGRSLRPAGRGHRDRRLSDPADAGPCRPRRPPRPLSTDAPWILPRHDRAYRSLERRAFRHVAGYQRLVRGRIYAGHELTAVGFCYAPQILRLASKQAAVHLRRQVADPALREGLRPTFTMGCKRVLLSDNYYRALTRDNVALLSGQIDRIVPTGIATPLTAPSVRWTRTWRRLEHVCGAWLQRGAAAPGSLLGHPASADPSARSTSF
jgi:cation diffusion facilitator CzcD-associated flavoprotein CzcO